MNDNLISAVFDSHSEAEAAARDLRQAGVPDSALSVIARRQEESGDYGDANTHEAKEKGEGALKGALGGAGAALEHADAHAEHREEEPRVADPGGDVDAEATERDGRPARELAAHQVVRRAPVRALIIRARMV